jgi:hypothetical protein
LNEKPYIRNKGVWEQGAEENIWTYEGGSERSELRNDELHNLYASTNIVTVFRSRRLRWVDYVAPIGEMRSTRTY